MNTNRTSRRTVFALATAMLALPLATTVTYANEVPLKIEWTGTFADTPWDFVGPDGLFVDMIYAQGRGSFGPSLITILTEFMDATPPPQHDFCTQPWNRYLVIAHSNGVTTFKNGDQLYFFINPGEGWMCLDFSDSSYTGATHGYYNGGTGRFENASGEFTTPFDGRNMTAMQLGIGFGSIYGEIVGTVDLQ